MNGVSKRGVLSLGLADIPRGERHGLWRHFVGGIVITGSLLGTSMLLIWWYFG